MHAANRLLHTNLLPSERLVVVMTNVAAGFCYISWVHCRRCNNTPHVELLNAATEQMKITELRLHKLVVSQQQQAASQSDASVAAERRAGLVFNHLMGACSLCHGSAQTTGTDCWHQVGLDASSHVKFHWHE